MDTTCQSTASTPRAWKLAETLTTRGRRHRSSPPPAFIAVEHVVLHYARREPGEIVPTGFIPVERVVLHYEQREGRTNH